MTRYKKYFEIAQKFEIRFRNLMNVSAIGALVGLLDLAVGLIFVLSSKESSSLAKAIDSTKLGFLIAGILVARSCLGPICCKRYCNSLEHGFSANSNQKSADPRFCLFT